MKTIFIVEDNETNLKLVSDILESQGYKLITANNGQSAIELITKNASKIDLILMDLQLPDIDGFTVISKLKTQKSTQDIVLWVLSAYAMDEDIDKARLAGCEDYITKPIQVLEFINKINGFLNK